MKQKALIFDSSTVISLALNNLLYILKNLKEGFSGKFIVTEDVKREIIDRPLQIKRFELESLGIQQILNEGILEMPSVLGVSDEEIRNETRKVMERANTTFRAGGVMKIISYGEASCFALGKILDRKQVENVLAIDERTARMLAEKPENLKKLYEKKLHTKVSMNSGNLSYFRDFQIIRSSELCYIAYKNDLIELKVQDRKRLLDALLYAMKYKGCAISIQEIEDLKHLQ